MTSTPAERWFWLSSYTWCSGNVGAILALLLASLALGGCAPANTQGAASDGASSAAGEPEVLREDKTYYANGRIHLIIRETLIDGKWVRHGATRSWSENGNLRMEAHYVNGVETGGLRKLFYDNGLEMVRVQMLNGEMHGHGIEWHENGAVATVGNYLDGKSVGRRYSWYSTGEPWMESNWLDGKGVGAFKRWHKSGDLAEKGDYLWGLKTGAWTTWFEDRQKKTVGSYGAGERTGRWITWHANGAKKSEGKYAIFSGETTRPPPDGDAVWTWTETGAERREAKHGSWIEWDEEGKVLSTAKYDHDKGVPKDK